MTGRRCGGREGRPGSQGLTRAREGDGGEGEGQTLRRTGEQPAGTRRNRELCSAFWKQRTGEPNAFSSGGLALILNGLLGGAHTQATKRISWLISGFRTVSSRLLKGIFPLVCT